MKFHWFLLAAALVLLPKPGQAQSADDKYFRVYGMIQDADRLNGAGDVREAVTRYLEAQVAMKNLQRMHPDWNVKLVGYRLDYISTKLEPLTRKASPAAASGVAEGADSPADSTAKQLKAMQVNIERLVAQNSLLEAKLREALSVQPAAVDPRELAKAEERIRALQKERDLLAITLEQAMPKGTTAASQGDEARNNLVTQTAVVDVLQKQNEELQKQITVMMARVKPANQAPNDETLKLKETLAALAASNAVMKEEQVTMENRLVDFVKKHGDADARDAELKEQLAEAQTAARIAKIERDTLVAKLNAVTKDLNQRDTLVPSVATQELERELEAIRAKVQIFEAKQVPYTAEELALFKQTPIKVAKADTNAAIAEVANKEAQAPQTGALVAEALRAIDTGRLDEAERKYRDVLRQDEKNVNVMNNLAAVQMDQDKVAEAEATLRQALEVDPQSSVSLYLMGGLMLRQEKYDEALDALSVSAKIDPESANTQYFLGKALVQKGNRAPAEAALRKAIQIKPGFGDAHYVLAVLYTTQEANFKGLAQYHYKKAIAGGAARNLQLEDFMAKQAAGK